MCVLPLASANPAKPHATALLPHSKRGTPAVLAVLLADLLRRLLAQNVIDFAVRSVCV